VPASAEGGRRGGGRKERGREEQYLDRVPAFDDGGVKLVAEDGDVAKIGGEGGREGGRKGGRESR
jgi:hypothetical protein